MSDPLLRQLVESLEKRTSTCPITLVLASSVHCGVAVARDTFLEELKEFAVRTSRNDLKVLAMDATTVAEPPGDFVHLLGSVVISGGQAVDSALTCSDGRSVFTMRPPARIRVAAVQSWHLGNVFEEAIERGG